MSLFLHVENTFSKLDSWILHNKYQLATSAGAIYCDTQDDLLWSYQDSSIAQDRNVKTLKKTKTNRTGAFRNFCKTMVRNYSARSGCITFF